MSGGVVITPQVMQQMTAALSNMVRDAVESIAPDTSRQKLTRIEVVEVPKCSVLTDKEAAALFSVDKATWRRWVKMGDAPQPVKFGTCIRWKMEDIQRMIEGAER